MIAGKSSRQDAAGDVRDGNYQRPRQTLPGVDLTSIRIESAGPSLLVTFTSSDDFPSSVAAGQSAVWTITACTPDGGQCCICGAKVVGNEWLAHVFDMRSARNTYVTPPIIRGKELIVECPRDKLPDWMSKPFKWWADSEWDGRWKDRIPNEGKDILNAPTVPFPE